MIPNPIQVVTVVRRTASTTPPSSRINARANAIGPTPDDLRRRRGSSSTFALMRAPLTGSLRSNFSPAQTDYM